MFTFIIFIAIVGLIALLIYGGAFLFDGMVGILNRIMETDFTHSEVAFAIVCFFIFVGAVSLFAKFYKAVNRFH